MALHIESGDWGFIYAQISGMAIANIGEAENPAVSRSFYYV